MSELESEFGCVGECRFPNAEHFGVDVTMYDSEGKEILCKCGNKAGIGFFGAKAYVAYCSECSLLENNPETELVYIPPPEDCTPIIQDDWVMNLRKPKDE